MWTTPGVWRIPDDARLLSPGDQRRSGARSISQLAAAAGVDEVPVEPLSELDLEPDPDEVDAELSDLAGSLAVDAPLRLSVR